VQKCAMCIALGTSGLSLTKLHPPAADCVPLMVNIIRERGKERDVESLVRHNFKIRQSFSVRPSQEARPQISELTQRSAQRRKLELAR
jgi:hypothetical protein